MTLYHTPVPVEGNLEKALPAQKDYPFASFFSSSNNPTCFGYLFKNRIYP